MVLGTPLRTTTPKILHGLMTSLSYSTATACPIRDAPPALPAAGVTSKQAGTLSTRNPLHVACWNVRTLLDPGSQCITMRSLYDYRTSICCLSEVRIPGTGSSCIKVPGRDASYWLYHSGPTDNSGLHGVAIALDAKAKQALIAWEPISPRILVARFRGKPVGVTVVSIYAPTLPSDDHSKDAFYEELQHAIDKVPRRDILIVAGDWNARTGKPDTNSQYCVGKFGLGQRCNNGERLVDFASYNRLSVVSTRFQHPKKHLLTWYSNDGRTAHQLDHILISTRWATSVEDCRSYRGAETGNVNGTDHTMVRARLKLHLSSRPRPGGIRRINTTPLEHPEKRQALSSCLALQLSNHDGITQSTSVDSQWDRLKTALQQASLTELGTISRKRKDWLSEATLSLSTKAREARLAGSVEYRSLRRQATRSARNDRNQYWVNLAQEMEDASNNGHFGTLFRLLRISSGRRQHNGHLLRDTNGQLIFEEDKKIERWAEHFSSLLNRPSTQSLGPDAATISEPYDVCCDPPTVGEISATILRLRNNKSPGEDGIPPEVYKACLPVLIVPLHELFCAIWQQEKFPTDWGTSLLLPIPKKGDLSVCDNYRGISLIDIAAKVFAVLLLNRFSATRDARTRPNQGGFRRGRGCVDQLFTLRRILEHRYSFQQPTTACFVDFRAAFDSVDRDSLWRIMLADGMPAKFVNLMQSYYAFTRGRVRAYGTDSSTFPIVTGVRQGCPLSPVLFNFAIDWTMRQAFASYEGVPISPNLSISDLDYADDIVVLGEDPSTLQPILDSVSQYASLLGLRINVRKTKFFTTAPGPHLPLMVDGESIESVNTFRYLGSVLLPTGQAKSEVPVRIQSARVAFSRLRSVLFCRREISLRTKMRVYKAAIRPVLTYGCETWPVRVEDAQKLEVFDHWCLRRILNIRWEDRVTNDEVRHRCFEIPRLSSVLRQHRLRWFGHTLRRAGTDLVRATLSPLPCPGWRRRLGGQLKTWIATIKSDVELLGLRRVYGLRQWDRGWLNICADLASDRRAWAAAIRDIHEADSSSRRR